jgi:enoyl-CoA hydratase
MKYDLPDELTVTSDGPVRIVTLNRPEHLNAVNDALEHALIDVWRQMRMDSEARAVVITGAGRAFSAGGDIATIDANSRDFERRYDAMRNARMMIQALVNFELPVIAAVNGPGVGLGASLPALCDIVFMAEDAYLSDAHVLVGLVAGDGTVFSWPLVMSLLLAKEYILTGDRISSAEAYRIGLANHVVPRETVLADAVAFAHKISLLPPFAIRETKRALNLFLQRTVADVFPMALAAESESFVSPDVANFVRRFKEKDAARTAR